MWFSKDPESTQEISKFPLTSLLDLLSRTVAVYELWLLVV